MTTRHATRKPAVGSMAASCPDIINRLISLHPPPTSVTSVKRVNLDRSANTGEWFRTLSLPANPPFMLVTYHTCPAARRHEVHPLGMLHAGQP